MTLLYNITKLLILVICFIANIPIIVAQPDPDPSKEGRERIEAARIGFITQKLNLTPSQAEKFWPLFNEYDNKRRAFREDLRNKLEGKERDELTEEDKRKILDFEIEIKEKELQLTKEYKEQFMEILSVDQMLALREAEDEFRKILLNRMRHKREDRENRHDGRFENKKEHRRIP